MIFNLEINEDGDLVINLEGESVVVSKYDVIRSGNNGKLTLIDIARIRKLRKNGVFAREIAEEYEILIRTVFRVVNDPPFEWASSN